MKFEAARIHFLSDVFVALAVIDVKLPYFLMKPSATRLWRVFEKELKHQSLYSHQESMLSTGRKWIPFGFASAFGEIGNVRRQGLGRVSGFTADQSRDKWNVKCELQLVGKVIWAITTGKTQKLCTKGHRYLQNLKPFINQ